MRENLSERQCQSGSHLFGQDAATSCQARDCCRERRQADGADPYEDYESWQLVFLLNRTAENQTRKRFAFMMKQLSLSPMAGMATTIKKQEQELEILRAQISSLKRQRSNGVNEERSKPSTSPCVLMLALASEAPLNSVMHWKAVDTRLCLKYDHAFFVLQDGRIRCLIAGMYQVHLNLCYGNNSEGQYEYKLQLDDQCIQERSGRVNTMERKNTDVCCVVAVQENQELSVVCTDGECFKDESSMSLTLLVQA